MKYIIIISLFFSSLLLSYDEIEDLRELKILSPSLQGQKSAKIRLANGLEALVISDPDANKSGAAMTVLVGSWSDPEEHPGMAHFLEHMLFLGTKEYPDESEYDHFIHDHGGENNAFTDSLQTSYMFSIDTEYLEEGLSRFSSFFKNPLLDTSLAKRELKVIDQEHAKNIEDDARREYAVHKSLLNPKHPSHRFATGNSETLGTVSQKELKNFYETHYSAHLMRLVIIGKEPLDTLKNLVEEKFGGVPYKNIEQFSPSSPLSNPEYLGKLVVIEPKHDIQTLKLIFELPKHLNVHETKSDLFIRYILTYEGPKSLLSYLKRDNLAESLHVSATTSQGNSAELEITIYLSNDGVCQADKVLFLTLQALKQLSLEPLPEHAFNEMHTLSQITYQFQDRQDVYQDLYDKAEDLAGESMTTFPEKSEILGKFDPTRLMDLAKNLDLGNAYIYLTAKNHPLQKDQKEKWSSVQFGIHPLPAKLLNALKNPTIKFKFWHENQSPFLPLDLNERPKEEEFSKASILPIPKPLLDDASAHILFAQENRYLEHKSSIALIVRDKTLSLTDIKSSVLTDLYYMALHDALGCYAPKALARYSIDKRNFGFSIYIEGFSHPCTYAFTEIIELIQSKKLKADRFSSYKEQLKTDYLNQLLLSPKEISPLLLNASIYKNEHLPEVKEKALADITEDDFLQFTESLFSEGFVEGIIIGNQSSEEAETIALKAKDVFAKTPLKRPFLKDEMLDLNSLLGPIYLQKEIAAQGNGAHLIIKSPLPYSFKAKLIHEILSRALEKEFFAELRTKQQTGYIVQTRHVNFDKHLMSSFFVQSSTHSPRDLLARFELFIESFLQELGSHITEERFDTIKNALIFEIRNPDKNLSTTASKLISALFLYDGDFLWSEKSIEALENLSYEECLEGIQSILQKSNKQRLALLLQGTPSDISTFEYSDAGDLEHFKNKTFIP